MCRNICCQYQIFLTKNKKLTNELLFVIMQIETKGENICLFLISNLIIELWILCLVSIELISYTHFRNSAYYDICLSHSKPADEYIISGFLYVLIGKRRIKGEKL